MHTAHAPAAPVKSVPIHTPNRREIKDETKTGFRLPLYCCLSSTVFVYDFECSCGGDDGRRELPRYAAPGSVYVASNDAINVMSSLKLITNFDDPWRRDNRSGRLNGLRGVWALRMKAITRNRFYGISPDDAH